MVTVDQPGLYDLHELGRDTPIVLTDRHRKSKPIPFRITKAAHRKYPYARVYFRFRVRIAEKSKSGFGYADMRTGSGSSAKAEFVTKRKHGHLTTRWTIVHVNGSKTRTTRKRSFTIEYPNVMLFDDAAAGKHKLRFTIEHYEGLHFEEVRISPRTGIALTAKSPYAGSVTATARAVTAGPPRVGKAMVVAVRVRNLGAHAATDVPVQLQSDRGLRIVGARTTVWSRIPARRTVEHRVTVIPVTPGRHALGLRAESGGVPSSGELVFSTYRGSGSSTDGGLPAWIWVALGSGLASAAVWRWRTAPRLRRSVADR